MPWRLELSVVAGTREDVIEQLKIVLADAYSNDFADANRGFTMWGHIAMQRFSTIKLGEVHHYQHDLFVEKR
jgi:hypothetical protein